MQQEDQILQWIQENPMISQQELAVKAGITRSTVSVHISNLMKKGKIAGRGYIMGGKSYAVVVGGINMDIGGTSYKPLVRHDSNPGQVRMSPGGVGRNIAHNMSLLGMDVRMITALGDDVYAGRIQTSCAGIGIDLSQSIHVKDARTSTYLFIAGDDGEMEMGVADMEIYDSITPEFLSGKLNFLDNAAIVVADTNIPEDSLVFLAENCRAPLFVDPVSTAKAVKIRKILGRIHTLKPNRIEAEMLSGVKIEDRVTLKQCADSLLDTGLERIFISLGADGVYAAGRGGTDGGAVCRKEIEVPCCSGDMVNTTGCGDAFMAALAWSFMEGYDLEQSAKAGLAASAIAMEASGAINPRLNVESLKARAAQGGENR